jgi:hypothetical protein
MKEVTYFQAHDGKQFENKEDCRAYEKDQSIGSDARFVNALEEAIRSIISSDDRGNTCVFGDVNDNGGDIGFIELAVHIANSMPHLWDVYNVVEQGRKPRKRARSK